MFIVELTYKKTIDEVERVLPAHVEYLKAQYAAGHFLASGRKIPRTGGIILVTAPDKDALMRVLQEDPFWSEGIAEYTVTEFCPSMVADGLEAMQNT